MSTTPDFTPQDVQPTPVADTPFTQAHVDELVERVEAAEGRAAAAEKAAAQVAEKAARFAVWDVTYEKFLPGVHDDRKAADKAAKEHKGRTQVREV